VKGQKNEILTRPKSRHSSRPDVFPDFDGVCATASITTIDNQVVEFLFL
jgi:hypothetical protein